VVSLAHTAHQNSCLAKSGDRRDTEGVEVGQDISFLLLALPDREFMARIDYV
jgi:hypothetical protein